MHRGAGLSLVLVVLFLSGSAGAVGAHVRGLAHGRDARSGTLRNTVEISSSKAKVTDVEQSVTSHVSADVPSLHVSAAATFASSILDRAAAGVSSAGGAGVWRDSHGSVSSTPTTLGGGARGAAAAAAAVAAHEVEEQGAVGSSAPPSKMTVQVLSPSSPVEEVAIMDAVEENTVGESPVVYRVGLSVQPPFCFAQSGDGGEEDGSGLLRASLPPSEKGLMVDVWERVAGAMNLTVSYSWGTAKRNMLKLKAGELDVLASGTPSLGRMGPSTHDKVAFSAPVWSDSYGVVGQRNSGNMLSTDEIVVLLLSPTVWRALSVVLFMVLLFAHLYWVAERNSQEFVKFPHDDGDVPGRRIPRGYLPGIGASLYWAISTFARVGYGDTFPKKQPGKVVACAWMVVSVLMACNITASLCAAYSNHHVRHHQVHSLQTLADLNGQRVAVPVGTFPQYLLTTRSLATVVVCKTCADAAMAVVRGEVFLAMCSKTELAYEIGRERIRGFLELSSTFAYRPHGVGLAVSKLTSPAFQQRLRASLAELLSSPEWDELTAQYFPRNGLGVNGDTIFEANRRSTREQLEADGHLMDAMWAAAASSQTASPESEVAR